jgi:APA family basic amino acid/polyamine antiporter
VTRSDLPRTIGFLGAVSVSIGIIIGSGIFRTPTHIAQHLSSPGFILLLWAAGGLIALLGALTYAELACMHPHSGGVYVFLREAYGRGTAFVFGWTYLLVSKPLAAAGIAIVFGEHLNKLLGVGWDPRLATIGMLVFFTVINVLGVRLGAGVAFVLTLIKALALAAIVVLALSLLKGDARNLAPQPRDGVSFTLLALVPVMAGILWTYDGWSDVGAIAGEVKDPQRTLPRVYLAAVGAVTLLYLAVNAVYMWMLPLAEIAATNTVAPMVVEALVGGAGAVAVTLIVVISTAGSTHGSIMTGARISFAQARDGLLFAPLARVHPRFQTPHVSLWAQLLLSSLAAWFVGQFERLAGGFVFSMWIFYGLAGAAIFILRRRHPEAPRPFRCPGYPLVPALFVLVAVGMTGLSIAQSPQDTLPWVAVLLIGFPVYWVWRRVTGRGGGATASNHPGV